MPHPAVTIANSILGVVENAGKTVDPMRIQKLVYFTHGWHLGLGHGPLASSRLEAWQWGPVFPDLYHAVKRWGRQPILDRIPVFRASRNGRNGWIGGLTAPSLPPGETFALQLVERVWNVYGHLSGPAMSQLTHMPGTPWRKVRRAPGGRGAEIPDDLIEAYYRARARENGGRP